MAEYISSEELQRTNSVFAEKNKKETRDISELDRLKKQLDTFIKAHSSTTKVRELAKSNPNTEKYGTDYQLDLSADIVLILEDIKGKLR